jgi:putative transposase
MNCMMVGFSEESAGHLLAQPTLSFPFIAQHAHEYPIRVLCRRLQVSESGYYAWKSREPSQQSRDDARLSAAIQQIFVEHRQVYGSPRIHAVLTAGGIMCSRKRVVRLMRASGFISTGEEATQANYAEQP